MGTWRQRQTKPTKATVEQQTTSSHNSHLHPTEELQEMLGNQALGRLIESQSSPENPGGHSPNLLLPQIATGQQGLIQRQPLFRGFSHELKGQGQGYPVQAKLTVNQPDDKYEREADRVASQVVQQMNNPVSETVQRHNSASSPMPVTGGIPVAPQLETAIAQQQGQGQPISSEIRKPLEQSLGTDFSSVRVHTNDQSDELNRSLQAVAFTTGQDIFFKQGAYQPGSRQGQELLTHELAHVVQQTSGNSLQTNIQRSQADGMPARLNFFVLDPETFHKQTKGHQRGEYLETIEKWLKAVQEASSWDDQQYALLQVAEACAAFLEHNFKHKMMKGLKEKDWDRNQEIRHEVEATQKKASQLLDDASQQSSSNPSPGATSETAKTKIVRGRIKEATEGGLGTTDSISASAGSLDDIHNLGLGDKVKSDYLDTGTNLIGGGLNTVSAAKELLSKDNGVKEKIEAGGNLVAGLGQTTHGVGKITKVAGGLAKGDDFKLGSAFGEIGGAIGDSSAAFGGLISTTTGIVDLFANWKESTKTEKVERTLDIAGNMAATAQSGVKTASGAVKSAAAVAGQEAAAQTVSTLGTASSIIGIVMGSIQVAQGGFQIYRGLSSNLKAKAAEKEQARMIAEIGEGLQQVKAQLPDLFATGDRTAILEVGEKMRVLRDTLITLQEAQIQSAPAMAALKKIGNRRMEEGGMKVAGGTLGIVSGALILSGVGAPIAIAIGALGGLLGLGYAGVKLARNWKADALMELSKRLSDEGTPQAKPDPTPDYRIMAERVYKCYYKHLPQVLLGTQPAGMDKDEFTKVKEFAWEDKKNRVESDEKVIINRPSQADQLDKDTKQNKWIEVQDSKQKATHKEKPKGWDKVHYKLSASAHKSKQSLKASKEDLATILTLMCMQSFDVESQQFINSPIKPMGEADSETVAEFGDITLKTLLSAAGITEKKWSRWFEKYGADEAQLREKVLGHIS